MRHSLPSAAGASCNNRADGVEDVTIWLYPMFIYFPLPQNRHPERSDWWVYGVTQSSTVAQSKDPETLYLIHTFGTFSTSSFRAPDPVVQKVSEVWVALASSGSFGYVARKVRELLRSG